MKDAYLVLVSEKGSETLHTLNAVAQERFLPAFREFIDEHRLQPNADNPRNCRPVTVYQFDEAAYETWRQDRLRSGGKVPGELIGGMDFPSAVAASRHLGYGYNRIALLLADVESKGEAEAEEGGVTWRYTDTIKA